MAKFAITWSLGRVEHVIQEAAATVEEFVNIHFGSMWEEATAAGVTVTPVIEPVEVDPAEAEAAAKATAEAEAAAKATAEAEAAAKAAAGNPPPQ